MISVQEFGKRLGERKVADYAASVEREKAIRELKALCALSGFEVDGPHAHGGVVLIETSGDRHELDVASLPEFMAE